MPNTEQSIEETGGIPVIEMEMEVSGMTQTAVDKTLSIPDMAADSKATGDAIQTVADDLANLATDVSNIEQWTGEDIPLDGTEESPKISAAYESLAERIETLEGWTGEDIPLNSEQGAQTIADAIAGVFTNLYPVGSLYITTAESLPSIISSSGTWVEVAIPLTWNDIRSGSRSYIETETGFTPGTLHFWLRTE